LNSFNGLLLILLDLLTTHLPFKVDEESSHVARNASRNPPLANLFSSISNDIEALSVDQEHFWTTQDSKLKTTVFGGFTNFPALIKSLIDNDFG
jgi:hypothetical protein